MNERESVEAKILDQCLSLLQSGNASIEACLAEYPEYSEVLEPLLRTAFNANSLMAPASPRAAFVRNSKIRILNQVEASNKTSANLKKGKKIIGFLSMRPAYALLSLALVLGLLLSGLGVTTASASALPGDALYGLKRGIEETQLIFTFSPSADAALLLQFTNERLEEAALLADTNRDADLPTALEGYESLLDRLIELADTEELAGDTETLDKIQFGLDHHQEVLASIYEKAPPQAKKGLENAMERSRQGMSKIEKIKEGGRPSDQAPGLEKKDENSPDEHGGGRPDDKTPKGKPIDKTPGPPDQSD